MSPGRSGAPVAVIRRAHLPLQEGKKVSVSPSKVHNASAMSCPLRLIVVLAGLPVLCALADQTGISTSGAPPDSWPQWRGPLANGVAPRANPPVHWSETN